MACKKEEVHVDGNRPEIALLKRPRVKMKMPSSNAQIVFYIPYHVLTNLRNPFDIQTQVVGS